MHLNHFNSTKPLTQIRFKQSPPNFQKAHHGHLHIEIRENVGADCFNSGLAVRGVLKTLFQAAQCSAYIAPHRAWLLRSGYLLVLITTSFLY